MGADQATATNAVAFAAGVATVLVAAEGFFRLRLALLDRLRAKGERPQDDINLDALGQLTRSENVALQRSAAQMLMDRAMQDENLQEIVRLCREEDNCLDQLKAATTLGLLAKNEDNKAKLVEYGALEVLARCVCDDGTDLALQRVAIIGMFDLIYSSDTNKELMVELGLTKALLHILDTSKSKDLLYWALVVVHQLTQIQNSTKHVRRRVCDDIMSADGLRVLVQTTRSTQGHSHMQKLCLHAFSLISDSYGMVTTGGETEVLQEIVRQGVIPPAVVCLKADDQELVYWSIFLLHKMALKDVGKDEIRTAPNILKAFHGILTSTDANVQTFVLRTLGFLAIRNDDFKERILGSAIVEHLVVALQSSNSDLTYWAVVLLHDLAMCGESAPARLINLPGLVAALVHVVKKYTDVSHWRKDDSTSPCHLVAETFGFLCSSEAHHAILVENGALEAIAVFARSQDGELMFWAAALLLNITVTNDDVKKMVVQQGGVDILMDLIDCAQRPQVPPMAAKTLVMLGLNDSEVNRRVERYVLTPIMDMLINLAATFPQDVNEELQLLAVFARGDAHKCFMANYDGFIESLAAKVWHLAHRTPALAMTDGTFIFAHGKAAVRVLVVLSAYGPCRAQLLHKGALSALSALVLSLNLKDPLPSEPTAAPPSDHPSLQRLESLPTRESLDSLLEPAEPLRPDDPGADEALPDEDESPLMTLKQQAVVAIANAAQACSEGTDRRLFGLSGAVHALWAAALRPHSPPIGLLLECTLALTARPWAAWARKIRASGATTPRSEFTSPATSRAGSRAGSPVRQEASSDGKLAFCVAPCAAPLSLAALETRSQWVELDAKRKTPNLIISPEQLEIRNDSWTFESIRATVCVGGLAQAPTDANPDEDSNGSPGDVEGEGEGGVRDTNPPIVVQQGEDDAGEGSGASGDTLRGVGGKWGYEVRLVTSGILQIGWASADCLFEPEKGVGVGDDSNSYAFDGSRCRAWHGGAQGALLLPNMGEYGCEWRPQDHLTVLFDVDARTMSFCLNGEGMGVAFTDVDTSRLWFPAASAATEQQCRFNFGAAPFRYPLPDGFRPIQDALGLQPPPVSKAASVVETPEYRAMFDSKLAAQQASGAVPTPTLYFEAHVPHERATELSIGMTTNEGVLYMMKTLETGHIVFAKQTRLAGDQNRDHVVSEHAFPEQSFAACRYSPGATVGCGVVLPEGRLFFTLNGLCVGTPFMVDYAYEFQPCVSAARLELNVGQFPFVYDTANRDDVRDRMAASLAVKAMTLITPIFADEVDSYENVAGPGQRTDGSSDAEPRPNRTTRGA